MIIIFNINSYVNIPNNIMMIYIKYLGKQTDIIVIVIALFENWWNNTSGQDFKKNVWLKKIK